MSFRLLGIVRGWRNLLNKIELLLEDPSTLVGMTTGTVSGYPQIDCHTGFFVILFSVMEIKLDNKNLFEIATQVSRIIKNGGVAILPFDTVYGFVCDPKNNDTLEKLFAIKKRPFEQTIGIAVHDIESAKRVCKINANNEEFMAGKVPGQYTFILPASDESISKYCRRGETIGIRIPDNKLVLEVAKLCGGSVAQTSANLTGKPECYSITELKNQFSDNEINQFDIIVDRGEIKSAGASRIFDLTSAVPLEIKR